MQNTITRQYYTLSCLFNAGGMSIISAIYVTYLINNGLNLLEVNIVNAAYFITLFVFEIPTGAFADIFGRKKSFIIACTLMCVSMFVYGCSSTFTGFIIAEVLAAIGSTFRNGAFQAWFVDSMEHHGHNGEFTRIFGRETIIRQVGGGLGAIIGSFLTLINPAFPWFFGGMVMAITTMYAHHIMREDYFIRSEFSWKKGLSSMKEIAISSFHYGKNHKAVQFILIVTGLQIYVVQPINMYWQPFFNEHGVGTQYLGFIFAGMMLSLAFGGHLVSKIDCKGKEKRMIIWSYIIVGIMIFIVSTITNLPAIILLFILHEIPRGAWTPLIDSYLQKRIPSNERATISSFCATTPHIGGAIGLGVSGLIAEHFGITTSWIISGIVLTIGAILVAQKSNNN